MKAAGLKVGYTFTSKGTKLKVARIKSETDTTITLFCLSYILSSYLSVTLNKDEEVQPA